MCTFLFSSGKDKHFKTGYFLVKHAVRGTYILFILKYLFISAGTVLFHLEFIILVASSWEVLVNTKTGKPSQFSQFTCFHVFICSWKEERNKNFKLPLANQFFYLISTYIVFWKLMRIAKAEFRADLHFAVLSDQYP